MIPDLSFVLSLRRVLGLAAEGSGMAQALASELRAGDSRGKEVARKILLGFPVRVSLAPIERSSTTEIAMLASLIVGSASSSSRLVGRTGEAVSMTLERWIKAREARRLEERVMRFRSIVASSVLGGVMAMLSTLGPLVASFSFAGSPGMTDPRGITYVALAMTALSSAMLGLFVSGNRFFVTLLPSIAVFATVSSLALPLAAVPAFAWWGIK